MRRRENLHRGRPLEAEAAAPEGTPQVSGANRGVLESLDVTVSAHSLKPRHYVVGSWLKWVQDGGQRC